MIDRPKCRESVKETFSLRPRVSDPQNKQNLSVIAQSMFVLCLDQPIGPVKELDDEQLNGAVDAQVTEEEEEDEDQTGAARRDDVSLALQLLHGMGGDRNAGNRWYDKTMQVGALDVARIVHELP